MKKALAPRLIPAVIFSLHVKLFSDVNICFDFGTFVLSMKSLKTNRPTLSLGDVNWYMGSPEGSVQESSEGSQYPVV